MRYYLLLLFCGIIVAEGRRKGEEYLLRQAQPGNVNQDAKSDTMAETGSNLSTEPEVQTQTIEDEMKADIATEATKYNDYEITSETSEDSQALETTTDSIEATTNISEDIQAEEATIINVSESTETFKESQSSAGALVSDVTETISETTTESQYVETHSDVFETTTDTIKESQDTEVTTDVNESTPKLSEEDQNTEANKNIIETTPQYFEKSEDVESSADFNEATPTLTEGQNDKELTEISEEAQNKNATKDIISTTPKTFEKSQDVGSSADFNETTPTLTKSQEDEAPNEGLKSPSGLIDEIKAEKNQKSDLENTDETPNQTEDSKENSTLQQEQNPFFSPGRETLGELELAYLPKMQRFLEEFSKVLQKESPTIEVEENLQKFLTPGYCDLNVTSSENLPLDETSSVEMSTKPSYDTEDPQVSKLIMEYYTKKQQKQSSMSSLTEVTTKAELSIGNLEGLTGILGLLQSGPLLGSGSLQAPTNFQSIMSSLQKIVPTVLDDRRVSSNIGTVQSPEQLTSTVDTLLEVIEHLRLPKSSRKKLEKYFKDKGRSNLSGSNRYELIQYLKYLERESESSTSVDTRRRFDEPTLINELRYFNLPSSVTQEFAEGLSRRFSNRKFSRKNKNSKRNRNRNRDNDRNREQDEDRNRNRNRNDDQEEDREDRDRIHNREEDREDRIRKDRYRNRNKNRDEDRDEARYEELDNDNNEDRIRNRYRDRNVDQNKESSNDRNWDRNKESSNDLNWDRNIDQETVLKQSRFIVGEEEGFKSGNIKIIGFENFRISKIAVKTDLIVGPRVDVQVDFGPLFLLPIDLLDEVPANAEFLLPISFGLIVRGRSRIYLQLKNFQDTKISPFDILLSDCPKIRAGVMKTYVETISEALMRRKSFVHSIESMLSSFVLMESTKDLFEDLNLPRR